MTVQYINTGSSSNSGNGDSLRLAFTKINNNFAELSELVGTTSTYNNILVNFTATTANLKVDNTATFLDLIATGTVTFGLLQGYDDFDLIKYDSDGLNLRLRNTFGESYSAINLIDSQSGSFIIAHQNREADTSRYLAGENYIYGTTPDQPLNIGRYSDINFWADEYKYYHQTATTTASIVITKGDGAVYINQPLYITTNTFYVDSKEIAVTTGNSITIDGTPISTSIDFNTVTSHIIPSADLTYDLGSTSSQWRSLYVGTSTIYIGGTPLSIVNGQLIVNDNPIVSSGSEVTSNTTVNINTNNTGTTSTWTFGSTGTLTFPDSTVQSIAYRPIIDTTYDELFALKTASELIPGAFYKITDFASIYDQPDFDSNGTAKLAGDLVTKTGPTEPLIVLATTVNAIAPQAWSTIYTGDTILYDIDYVSTIVTGTPCKGRIEFRKDSNNNQIPYDSRGILLKRYETISGSQVYDSFKDTGFAYRDDIPTFGDECENIVLTAHPATYGQGPGSDASIFLVTNNAFGLGCESIIATGGDFVNNTFGNFVFGIHVAHSFRNNSFGAGLADCHFLNNFANNRIGEGFINNIIENDFFNNVIGNNFQDNDIGSEFQDNTIGDGFTQNSVGNGFKNNIIGSIFTGNHINDYFQNNGDIGDNFSNNDIRYRFSENTIAANFQFNLTKTIITGTNFTATTSCYQTYTSEIVTPAATPESSTGEAYIGYLDVSTLQWVWTHV